MRMILIRAFSASSSSTTTIFVVITIAPIITQ